MGATRRLTPRQTAVLAAVERRGSATIPELREDFPQLAPSAVARVLDVLVAREVVHRAGDPSAMYLGGVRFWPARREPREEPDDLAALAALLSAAGWKAWVDADRAVVRVLIPLDDVRDGLTGVVDNRFDELRDLLAVLVEDFTWIAVPAELTHDRGEPGLVVELGMRFDEDVEPKGGDEVDAGGDLRG